jgi:putative membrane protein
MMRYVLSLLLTIGIGTMGTGMIGAATIGVAFAAVPPASPAPPPAAPPSTESFLASAASGAQFEIDSSKLALTHARSAAVKEFAHRMIDNYSSAAARLKEAVSRAGLPPPPEKLDAQHQAMLDDLKARDGASFDKAYVAGQVQVLRDNADLFRTYATLGDNARIKRFAQELLLTVRSHADDASRMR